MINESVAIALGLSTLVLFVVLYVWMALALSALFRKAGEEGWKGWVPVLNQAVLLQLGGYSPWLVLLLLIPGFGGIVVYVLYVISAHRINASFGYGGGMTVLAALLPVIWASILGFGTAQWISAPPAGPVRSSAPSEPPAVPPLVGGWTPSAPPPPPLPVVGPEPAPAAASSWAPSAPPAPTSGAPAPAWYSTGLDAEVEDSAVAPDDRAPLPASPPAGSFVPPAAPPAPAAHNEPVTPISSVPGVRSASPPASPPPVSPPSPPASPPTVPVADVPAPAPAPPASWTPATARPATETFPELSEAISAVAGAPDAGAPRSARSSVSALYADPGVPDDDFLGAGPDADDDEPIDRTIIAKRRRTPWKLVPPSGAPIDIGSDVVILGRRPAPDPAYPDAQLISIPDETRTVSKTHARLELRGDTWYVTDLGSTNGVLFATLMGTEVEAQPGQELEAGERFFLGDAEVRLRRSEP